MMSQAFATIDAVLGDSESRYFGEGHTRVRYAFSEHRTVRLVQCTTTIEGSRSAKGGKEAATHVSSLDAVVLADYVTKRHFAEVTNPAPALVDTLYMTRAVVKAGNEPAPIEEIAVSVEFDAPDRINSQTDLSVKARVANLDLDLYFMEAAPQPLNAADPWKSRPTRILDLVIGAGASKVSATALVEAVSGASSSRVQVPEALLIAAQMAQALVYCHDEMERSESHNLWMRRIDLKMEPNKPLAPGVTTEVKGGIDRVRDVPLGGQIFRVFRISGGSDHFTCSADIAHALPDRLAPRAARARKRA
ncbi:MAG: hypothetical protein LBJ02_06340 [Bifidobacteriaceae bacterium]|jgi:hypothetical protein|nr:hypothetical protein [Bifidobacteriaceae bacterium]